MPKISIVVPFHWMKNWKFFLTRCLESIEQQTFADYEVILTKAGSMPVNSNRAIKSAKGDIIKILYMDDYLAHPFALNEIAGAFRGGWLVTGCEHDAGQGRCNPHHPEWNDEIHTGKNTIGSPSVLAFENKDPLLFDEKLSWMLDVDLYSRLYKRYGEPTIVKDINVVIGLHEGQTTHLLPEEEKIKEVEYVINKYA